MGYKTQFGGELIITPPLTQSEHDRLLELCRLDNPRAEDVFSVTAKATDADREILGTLVEMSPWSVLFYEWRIGPCRDRKINDHGHDHEPEECWTVKPPDEEISGGCGDVEEELVFLHSWLLANGHELAGELSWSGSDAVGDTGTIYVNPVHGVEAVEDIHDNPGPSWLDRSPEPGPTLNVADVVDVRITDQSVCMDDGRKVYVIEFLYADNNQLYQTFARLTDEERERVEQYLNKLDENGDICLASSSYTCEWTDIVPHPSLKELAEEFAENTAFDGPREECGMEYCDKCGEPLEQDQIGLCDDCQQTGKVWRCEDCDKDHKVTVDADGIYRCAECDSELPVEECRTCRELYEVYDSGGGGGECPGCADRRSVEG